MESKVVVVHRSEIVRKGLSAILNPLWASEILQIGNAQDFNERGYCKSCRTLVFVEAGLLDKLRAGSENATLVAIFDTDNQFVPVPDHVRRINLMSGFEVFEQIFDDFKISSSGRYENENELTQREREILRQVAMGYSNKEIADSLYISIHTVITHRKNITGKLGIKSISGLTVYAIINRLIDPGLIDPEKLI
jgi:DNA-binding CsgD family transcriptional regulator